MVSRSHQVALDVCILAYQTYHQSLLWPLDAWYEALARMGTDRRTDFLGKIREKFYGADPDTPWGELLGPEHGDTKLDPVLTRYRQFDPKLPAFTINPGGTVVVLRAPNYLTQPIRTLKVARYTGDGGTVVEQVHDYGEGTDEMIAFVGATGQQGSPETQLWSLMGVVLRRQVEEGQHDLFISFRGSRSGSAVRAALQGILSKKGNADWVTDTGNADQAHYEDIARRGKVGIGFGKAVRTCFGTIEAAVGAATEGHTIRRIIATGHSLGGGLAGHFVSAVAVGTYGVGLRQRLGRLPWDQLKGVAMAMPPLGDEEYRRAFDLAQACGEFSLTNIWTDGDAIVEAVDKLGKGRLGFWSPGIRIRLPQETLSTKHTNPNPHEIIQIRASLMKQSDPDGNYPQDYSTMAGGVKGLQWGYFRHWAAVLENAPSSYTSHVAVEDTKLINSPAELRAMLQLYQIQPSMSMYATCLQEHFANGAGRVSQWIGHAEASLLVMLGKYLSQVLEFDDDILSPYQVMLANPEGREAVVAVLRNEVDHSKADIALSGVIKTGIGIGVAPLGVALVAALSPALLIGGAIKAITANRSSTDIGKRTKENKAKAKMDAAGFYVEVRVWLHAQASSFSGTLPQGQYHKRFGRHRSTAEILTNLKKLNEALMTARPKARALPSDVTWSWKEAIQARMLELQTHKANLERLALTR